MYDITQTESGDSIYTGELEVYGDNQEDTYGKKENLIECLQSRYNVKLGRHVRHLCGEIILFFPHKTGLIGKGLAQRQWECECLEPGERGNGLLYLTLGDDVECNSAAYHNLFRAFGLNIVDEKGNYKNYSDELLCAYYHNHLYMVYAAYGKCLRLVNVKRQRR